MKRVTIVRHAKSSWAAPAAPDHGRELAERGHRDARIMGRRLVARKVRPSLMLTSSAVRAVTTARAIADALSYPAEFLQLEDELYLASPDEIVAIIERQSNNFADVMIVGHNPGLTDLVNRLLPGIDLDNLPTGGAVSIEATTDDWAAFAASSMRLAFYDYPKNPEILLIED